MASVAHTHIHTTDTEPPSTYDCKIYRLVELVESSSNVVRARASLHSLQHGHVDDDDDDCFLLSFGEHDQQSQLPEKDICDCDSTLHSTEPATEEKGDPGVGQKIEKENRSPQRSAGYITKQVICQTSNRFAAQ